MYIVEFNKHGKGTSTVVCRTIQEVEVLTGNLDFLGGYTVTAVYTIGGIMNEITATIKFETVKKMIIEEIENHVQNIHNSLSKGYCNDVQREIVETGKRIIIEAVVKAKNEEELDEILDTTYRMSTQEWISSL